MQVYFSASLSKYRGLLPLTKDIAHIIQELGHEITSKHVIKEATTEGDWTKRYEPKRLFEREMRRLALSNVLITESTTPSFGAGFMIQSALALGKPCLTLHYGDELTVEKVPLMLRGHGGINLHLYTEENIKHVLQAFFTEVATAGGPIQPLEDFDQ